FSSDDADFEDSLLKEVTQTAPPMLKPVVGERLGGRDGRRFELLQELGKGAMGLVYRARDEELQRVVALKFLLPRTGLSDGRMITLLKQEARAVAQLNDENNVQIFDVAEWQADPWQPQVPFLVMECL